MASRRKKATKTETPPEPEYGELRGERVLLKGIAKRLSRDDLRQVVVTLPDGGTVRPSRFMSFDDEVEFSADPKTCSDSSFVRRSEGVAAWAWPR